MKKIFAVLLASLLILAGLPGCAGGSEKVKIGVSMGAGPAIRWDSEKVYMEERAEELSIDIEVRLNRNEEEKTQYQDCVELIDSGIDTLILMPRVVTEVGEIMAYAKEKGVPVISYARVILGEPVDLYVGYDSEAMGQKMGQYLAELVYEGDYILFKGDEKDSNAGLLYDGAMRYIDPIRGDINVLLDTAVEGWDPALAKEMVKEAVAANGNHVDAILAPNDKIAGACVEALEELGVTEAVAITGMDAEADALKRVVNGKQGMTIYMDLRELACTAVDEAVHMAKGEKVNTNAEYDNNSGSAIDANLIVGKLVVKENIDRVLIDGGYFTKEEIYG